MDTRFYDPNLKCASCERPIERMDDADDCDGIIVHTRCLTKCEVVACLNVVPKHLTLNGMCDTCREERRRTR